MNYSTIHDFIKGNEIAYKQPIRLNETWEWSMPEHIRKSSLYKHSQIKKKTKFTPIKNITRPILNLQYRTEGFDVKDIELFVDDAKNYFKSTIVRKYHEYWARKNALDTIIDEMVESYVDYGGALLKRVKGTKPEVVPLESIAFCDQTDLLSGPIGLEHFYSPDQLLDMASVGWGQAANGATISLQQLIRLSTAEKKEGAQTTKTPSKYIKVYETHGTLPKKFADPADTSEDYESRIFITAFYQKKNGDQQGVVLYTAPETESPFKLIVRDKIYGRALGFGGAEELFEPQKWVNYDLIRKLDMLDSASKTVLKTTDSTLKAKHPKGLQEIDNLEIIELTDGTDLQQIDTFPRNAKLFDEATAEWEAHAQQMGAANDAILGESPTSGTPFKLQELVTQESHGLHEYRKGKLATFWDEVEQDWIIPELTKDIVKGQTFLAEFDLDELQEIAEAVVTNEVNQTIIKLVLDGKPVDPKEIEDLKTITRDAFMKGGNQRFIEIFKNEMKDAPLKVRTNIVGKQKNLATMVDKLTNVMRFLFSTYNPQTGSFAALDDPRMATLLNEILEYSGLTPIDAKAKPPMPAIPPPIAAPQAAPQIATPNAT